MASGRLLQRGATLVALGTFAAALLAPAPARAFCRSNSCSPSRGEVCFRDAPDYCLQGGKPLAWPSSCATFAVQREGSLKHQIDAAEFEAVITRAFETWMAAECSASERPAIRVTSRGQVACGEVEYNADQGNANIYMFVDDEWLGRDPDLVYAVTTTHYKPDTGEIRDVDTEVNGTMDGITNSEPQDGADLASIITHEVGHFLGLDHSSHELTTMYEGYKAGGRSLRDLSADDIAGICAIYPPDRVAKTDSCEPQNGFRSECREEGCACRVGPSGGGSTGVGAGLLAFALWLTRRRGKKPATH